METIIRQGAISDSEQAVDVLRQSIIQLCGIDHQDDGGKIAEWLSNKTTASWAEWVNRKDAKVLVAECAEKILGVGMVNDKGEILLNYVCPEARFRGISKAILLALESWVSSRGIEICFLKSTLTARRFYESSGYMASADDANKFYKRL